MQVAELLQRAKDEVRRMGTDPAGRLSFGLPASVSMASSVLMAGTAPIEMPRMQPCAVDAMRDYIKQQIANGEINLGLLHELDGLMNCASRRLLHEDLCFYSLGA